MLRVMLCWSMVTYGGISIDSSPNGPLTCTVLDDCVLAPLPPVAFGGITLKATPGGIESGSDPILDSHRAVVVKVRVAVNRGKRNVGIESVAEGIDPAIACAHLRRAGENMLSLVTNELGEVFGRCECEVAMFSPMVA